MKILVIVLLVCIGACGVIGFGLYYVGKQAVDTASSEFEKITTAEGGNVDNPLGALSALGGAVSDLQNMQEDLENLEPVDPLPFQTIIDDILPEIPSNWEAQDPKGSSQSMGNFAFTQASRRYTGPNGEVIDVAVNDWAYNAAIYVPFFLAANFSQETTEGYNKGIKIGEDPGREEFTYARNRGERSVLYGKRFNIVVKGTGIEPAHLEEWYGHVRKDNLPTR